MRQLWQFALFFVFAGLLFLSGLPQWLWRLQQSTQTQDIDRFEAYRDHIGYVIDREQWTTFALPPGVDQVRLILTATVVAEDAPAPGERVAFVVRGEALGSGNDVLDQFDHHFLTRRTFGTRSQQVLPTNRYESDQLVALDRRSESFQLGSGIATSAVRFKLTEGDVRVRDVVARVYVPQRFSGSREQVTWARMTIEERRRAARASTLDHRFLSADEMRNVVRAQWQPVGPSGVENRDYRIRRVFSLDDYDQRPLATEKQLPGDVLLAGPGRTATFALPTEAGSLRLSAAALPGAGLTRAPIVQAADPSLRLWFYPEGRLPGERWGTFRPGQPFAKDHGGGGLLAVRSQQVYTLTATYANHTLPSTETLLPLVAATAEPLSFYIHGAADQAQPFRLNTFAFSDPETGQPFTPTAKLRVVAMNGQQSKTVFNSTIAVVDSAYHFTARADFLTRVGVTDPIYLQLPPDTREVQVYAEPRLWVAAAVRPAGLPYTQHSDFAEEMAENEATDIPAWFLVDAPNLADRRAQQEVRLVRHMREPRPRNALLASGNYVVVVLEPERAPLGRHIYVRQQLDEPYQRESAALLYSPIPANQSVQPQWLWPVSGTAAPRLLYDVSSNNTAGQQLTLWIDEQRHQQVQVSGQGTVHLGPLPPSTHSLRVDAPTHAKLYLNHQMPTGSYLLAYFAHRLAQQPLAYPVEKRDDEPLTVSGRFFSAADQPSSLRLQITPVEARRRQVARGYTLAERRYKLVPDPTPAAFSLPAAALNRGTPFYATLNEDLPPGDYRISLWLDEGPAGFVRLVRLLAPDQAPADWDALPAFSTEPQP